ncbi:hypothetical protein [Vibrio sp. 10N.286.46.E10]|uniref:hypothetical protein n=1 Tax=unclassified Vibrio TaxID=2614977 RepID=UPI000D3365F8|nr:hypothetical protein [Vibrio sp. 10N.286.46.E10]PTQ23662.1 hypothetical protein CWO24_12330 [Vibrio sp. 10N.286.46.E10]
MILRKLLLSLFFITFISHAEQAEFNLVLYKHSKIEISKIEEAISLNNRNIDGDTQDPDIIFFIKSFFLNQLEFDQTSQLEVDGSILYNDSSHQTSNISLNWEIIKDSNDTIIKRGNINFENLIGEGNFEFTPSLPSLSGDYTLSATAENNSGVESNTVSIPFYVSESIDPRLSLTLNQFSFDRTSQMVVDGSILFIDSSYQPSKIRLNWEIIKDSNGTTIKSGNITFKNLIGEENFRFTPSLPPLLGNYTLSAIAENNSGVVIDTKNIPFYVSESKQSQLSLDFLAFNEMYAYIKLSPTDPNLDFCRAYYTLDTQFTGYANFNFRRESCDSDKQQLVLKAPWRGARGERETISGTARVGKYSAKNSAIVR